MFSKKEKAVWSLFPKQLNERPTPAALMTDKCLCKGGIFSANCFTFSLYQPNMRLGF